MMMHSRFFIAFVTATIPRTSLAATVPTMGMRYPRKTVPTGKQAPAATAHGKVLSAASAPLKMIAKVKTQLTPVGTPTSSRGPVAEADEQPNSSSLLARQMVHPVAEADQSPNSSNVPARQMVHHVAEAGLQPAWHTRGLTTEPPVEDAEPPVVDHSAAAVMGIAQNNEGDLVPFLVALFTNFAMSVGMFVAFSYLRRHIPIIYMGNVLSEKCTVAASPALFGWIKDSLSLTPDEVITNAGLDQAMMLEFANFAMRLLLKIGLPLVLLLGPVHWVFGGNRSENDRLSKLGMGNVVDGHPWLYHVHSVVVWLVVVTVQRSVYEAQEHFLRRRKAWLLDLPKPRSHTVLVQNIPEEHRTDEKLKAYFNRIFKDSVVESAFVVKQTAELCNAIERQSHLSVGLDQAKFEEKKFIDSSGSRIDKVNYYKEVVAQAAADVQEARQKVEAAVKQGDPSIFSQNGFVTFKSRRFAALALKVDFRNDCTEFICQAPPDSSDVIYSSLQRDPLVEQARMMMGYGAIAGVYIGYVPAVVFISYLASLNHLAEFVTCLQPLAANPALTAVWDAMAMSVALQFVTGFVPTFFVTIFYRFFALNAEAWLQHRVQVWYFWFQVVFILGATMVDENFVLGVTAVFTSPFETILRFGSNVALTTHFFLNFIPLQWVSHAQNMLRVAQCMKYMGLRAIFEDDQAKLMSEPEDQDYYGIGSRTARHAFILVLGLVLCTLTPLITAVALVNFFVVRLVYGYLTVFAENRKPDLGGVFWVSQLKFVQQCIPLYVLLMAGVLAARANAVCPSVVAALSLFYWLQSYNAFDAKFMWERLCLEDIAVWEDKSRRAKTPASDASYEQPELRTKN